MKKLKRIYRKVGTLKVLSYPKIILSGLRQRNSWKHLILHSRRWTTLPPYIALPLLCGKAKNKLSCQKNLTIVLIHNYETESILEKSLRYVGIDNHVLLKPENGQWPANTQKIIELEKYIDSGNCSTEFILYIDSDDAVLRGDPGKAVEYLIEEDCDALYASTKSTRSFRHLPELKKWADKFACDNGYEKRYLNAGVFVAKTDFLKELLPAALEYVDNYDQSPPNRKKLHSKGTFYDGLPEFPKGVSSDQMIIRYLHPRYHSRIKIDFRQRLALK